MSIVESVTFVHYNVMHIETHATREILADLQPLFESQYGHSFIDAVTRLPGSQLQAKPTSVDKRREKRKIQRDCKQEIESHYKQTDALTLLAEGSSMQSYKRLRLSQSFESPKDKRARVENSTPKEKKHSPSFENATWDKVKVLEELRTFPIDSIINWSQFAREHCIPGKNNGQVVKEFAEQNGIDTFQMDRRQPGTRMRARKLKMPGKDISVPSHLTPEQIKEDWLQMIQTGELTLGEQCHPCTIQKYHTSNGNVTKTETTVYGRKIPLRDIREKLIQKHEEYMHLHTDKQISEMSVIQLTEELKQKNVRIPQDACIASLREKLKQSERTRTIAVWHDHATILGHGYVLVTAKILYDTAVFKPDKEIPQTSQVKNIQAFVEEPEVHILAMSSSSAEDQVGLITDRLTCIQATNSILTSSNGVPVEDRLMFFYGDKPAGQFERGCQQGGDFPCATCGCSAHRMDDLGHCFSFKWKDLKEIQTTATKGKAGKKQGIVRPFDALTKEEIKDELRKRDVYTSATTKKDLQHTLHKALEGIQRVPSLLIHNPTQPLEQLNLDSYQVLDCEPLHDLKGHINNIITELPSILDPDIKTHYKQVLEADLSKEKKTGADYRLTLIHLVGVMQKHKAPEKVCTLLQTLAEMSRLLYLGESERTNKEILRLYNTTWLHFELIKELFPSPRYITRRKLYGIYLHALTVHAPAQFQLMSLKSCNAEHEERLFGQAKDIATATSNRKPENIVPNILLRLQAKQKRKDMYTSLHTAYSKISKEAKGIRQLISKNTSIKHDFIKSRISSWQGHLQRISTYLEHGETWWKKTETAFEFFDGEETGVGDISTPHISEHHFRNNSLQNVQQKNDELWQNMMRTHVPLPTPHLRLYNEEGSFTGLRDYQNTRTEDIDETETESADTCDEESPLREPTTILVIDTPRIEEEFETEPQTSQSTLNSKLAKAVDKVLTNKVLVKRLDILRTTIKAKKTTTDMQHYRTVICSVKLQLEDCKKQLQSEIKKFEQGYYMKHSCLPTCTEQEYLELQKKNNYIHKLLRTSDFLI